MPLPTVAGVALLVGATLAGAALARSSRIPLVWLHGAAALVMGVLLADLLPEIWSGPGLAAAIAGYALAAALGSVSFGSAAAGIGVHRFVEGALLTLVISPAAVAAFVAHAVAEGFAIGATQRGAPLWTAAHWLGVACVAPVAGALLISEGDNPLLTAVAAGAIARAAYRSLRGVQPPESSSSAPSETRSDSRSSSHP